MTWKRKSTDALTEGEITFLYSGSRECFRGDSLGDDLVPCVLSLTRGFEGSVSPVGALCSLR